MRRAGALGRGHHQIGKGDGAELAAGLARQRSAGLLEHGQPVVGGEQRRLAGMRADRDHQAVGKPRGLPDHVEMAVGDGVERPGKSAVRGIAAV